MYSDLSSEHSCLFAGAEGWSVVPETRIQRPEPGRVRGVRSAGAEMSAGRLRRPAPPGQLHASGLHSHEHAVWGHPIQSVSSKLIL